MACMMLVRRVLAPLRIATAVREIAALDGTPPNQGATRLAIPCAISSWSGSNGLPLSAAPAVPVIRLSMAASAAIENPALTMVLS